MHDRRITEECCGRFEQTMMQTKIGFAKIVGHKRLPLPGDLACGQRDGLDVAVLVSGQAESAPSTYLPPREMLPYIDLRLCDNLRYDGLLVRSGLNVPQRQLGLWHLITKGGHTCQHH